jgi:hypothetical protein
MTLTENQQTYQKIKDRLSDRHWRLNNLYKITDKSGKEVTFKMNWAQQNLYDNLHYFDLILKARQLGFTTFIMIYFLDACLFNSNHKAGVIAHTLDDAKSLFRNKVKFAYDRLPEWLKEQRKAKADSARTLEFNNGSSIYVGTSLRSGTFQKLLVSEYGKLSAKYPEKAKEVKTGALNTVEAGQQIFVESTAEGRVGEFYDLCEQARKLTDTGKELARIQPKFFFYAWWQNPEYVANEQETRSTVVADDMAKYFDSLMAKGISLSPEQKAWYVLKSAQQGEDIRQEYPSTPEEAFEGSLAGAFYTEQMRLLRKKGQITNVPYDPQHPVYTFWDLGTKDMMTCLFYQYINGKHCFIDYYENNGEGWQHYANMLADKGYHYAKHYFPHDGNNRMRGKELYTDREVAIECGIRPIQVTNRTANAYQDIINSCMPLLPHVWIDEQKCAKFILHLDNSRRKYNKQTMMFEKEELHDEASHGNSAFRTFAVNPSIIHEDTDEVVKDPNAYSYNVPTGSWMGG